jgi:hypothetical protein
MAQQQSQNYQGIQFVTRAERSLNSGSDGIGGMACKHDCSLRQLIASAEFEIKLKRTYFIMTMGVCDTTGRVLGINIISNAKDNVKHI